jgi:hypothetical protein
MQTMNTERAKTEPTAPVASHEQAVCNGYGACSKSGCNCQAYEGSAGTCGNRGCGHAYEDHW